MGSPRRRDYFFYGTLMDDDVLVRVVGTAVRALTSMPAWIDDYERRYVAGATYPVLISRPGERVDGRLLRGLDRRQEARLARYEADFYDLKEVSISTADGQSGSAMTFLPRSGIRPSPRVWQFDDWQRRHKRTFMRRIDRWIDR